MTMKTTLTTLAAAAMLLAMQHSYAQQTPPPVRTDDTVQPTPGIDLDDEDENEEGEFRASLQREDWINQRFGGPLDKFFFDRNYAEIQAQATRHPELLTGSALTSTAPRWKPVGPVAAQVMQNYYSLDVVDSGRLRSILPHPSDPNTMYVLSAGGGLWKTTNFSASAPTWTAMTDATVTTSGGAAALGGNPDTIYMGLGDPIDGIALLGGYMLRSTNGGVTWSAPVSLPTALAITDVKVDSSGATDTVLVATKGGLYRSADGGVSYQLANGIDAGRTVGSLVKTSAGWLAATYVADPCCRFGIGADAVMYVSTDGGANFAPIANAGAGYSDAGRTTLSVGAPGDSIVYAIANVAVSATADGSTQRDAFRSEDGGQTWTALGLNALAPTNPNPEQSNMDIMHAQAWYNQMIVVDPSDPARNTVHLGGNLALARTTDGGKSWTIESNWLAQFGLNYAHADNHVGVISTVGGMRRILVGNDGGLTVSEDGGTSWNDRKNIGLTTQLMYSLSGSGVDASSVIVGLQDNGTRLRVNGTGTFNQTIGGDGFGTGWSQANGGAVLGSLYNNRIKYATTAPTDQSKWKAVTLSACNTTGLENCNTYFFTTVAAPNAAADPTGKVFFARNAFDLYRTTNGGQAWASISKTDPNRTKNSVRGAMHVIGVHPTDVNRIAAAASGGKVRITTDGGATWLTRSMPATVTAGFNAAVAWVNNTTLFVASENVGVQPGNCWLAKSTDLGVTWTASCTGLPKTPITKVLVSPADPTGMTVYAATWIGVYKSINGGKTWDQFGAGLPVVKVSDLYMPPRGGLLRVATYGRGVWEVATPR